MTLEVWWSDLTWYGRRPWHWLFGHGECQKFLDRWSASKTHRCCFCGLPCRER